MEKTKVEKLIEKAKALNLMGLNFILGFSVDAICKAYNGIGPQFLAERLRNRLRLSSAYSSRLRSATISDSSSPTVRGNLSITRIANFT